MPERSRSATLKQSAPPANDNIRSPRNSSEIFDARLVVTAWRARPERYIMSSRSNVGRQLFTSSVFVSFSPNVRPLAAATRRRLWNIGTASTYMRSCPNASSGTGMSSKPSESLTMPRTRSAPSNVGLHLTDVCRPRSSSRYSEIFSISSGGQPCIVDSVIVSESCAGMSMSLTAGYRSATRSMYPGR